MDARLPAGPDAVNERQREVARLVAEGRTNPEIAAHIASRTASGSWAARGEAP